MGKDLHNDNFEDFIKKNLEGFDDEPSDAMWDRIAPVIPPKPSTNWSAYVLPTVLVLSLALVTFFGVKMYEYKSTSEILTEELKHTNHKIDALTDKVEHFSNDKENGTIAENSTTVPQIDENVIIKENKKIKTKHKRGEELNVSSNILNQNTTTQTQKSKPSPSSTNPLKDRKGQNIANRSQVNNGSNIPTNSVGNRINTASNTPVSNILENENNDKKQQALESGLNNKLNNPIKKAVENTIINNGITPLKTDLELLATLNIKPYFPTISPNITGIEMEEDKKSGFFKTSSITFFVAPTIIKNNIRPERNSGLPPPPNTTPKPEETIRLGKSIGVKFNTGLSERLSLTVGGVYSKSSFDFKTKHKLRYNKDNEENLSTDKMSNNIDYSGSSTYGEYSVGLDVTRLTNSTINQNEEIEVELDATVDVELMTIPIYLTYKIVNQDKFSIGLKGGMSYNKIIGNDLVINDFKINRDGIEVKEFGTQTAPKPTQNMSFNVVSGVVLDYALTDNWGLSLEPTWSSALSDNNRGALGRTKSSIFSLEAGVKYTF